MLKIIRYAIAICLAIISIIYFKNKEKKKRLFKLILGLIISVAILMIPFENLVLKFNTPERALNYLSANAKIIKTIEEENSALVIYTESGHIFAITIYNCDGKWKAPFLPEDQILSRFGKNSKFLITKERNSNNFYIMISVDGDTKVISDNQNSKFELFKKSDYSTHYVAYVSDYEGDYIINIDGEQYKINISWLEFVFINNLTASDCYIRGTNLVAKYNYRNGDKSEYTYYTQNAHGDVVNLTNAEGKVTKKYTYDAFGVEKNIDKNDSNAFRYCGEYFDAETGTIYLRARYYNPSTGRFISRDSFAGRRSDPLSLNLYTYCRNNPIRYVDPSGHSYATLPDGTTMTINSAADAEKFYFLRDKQLVNSSENALSSGKYTVSDVVSAYKREDARNNSYNVPTYDQFVMMSKKRTARPDSGLSSYSDEEISKFAHDKSLSSYERKRFQTEEKERGLRNKQKRQDYNKKKDNSSKILLPDLYGLDNFKEAVDNLYAEEIPASNPSFIDVLEGSSIMLLSGVAMIFILGDDITGAGAADNELLEPLQYYFEQGFQMVT